MSSTLPSDTILEVKDLNLIFRMNFYQSRSMRDVFVNTLKSPIRTLFKNKETLHVLKNINLNLKRGDRLGVLGVNGAGKTTLCRCIANMLVPETGSVNINGKVRPIFNISIGILPELTGRENGELLAKLLYPSLSKSELKALVDEALEFSELGDFLKVPYSTYSKGMQARLCLSIISAKSCDLLILDEVFDGADEYFQKKISERILKIIKDSGAVIFVSHSPEQVKLACNRVIVLHKSGVAYDGNVEIGVRLYKKLTTYIPPKPITNQA